MRIKIGKSLVGYGAAVLASAGAILLRWLIDPWLGDDLPLVTLYGAVALAVGVGGYGPALLAMLLGFLACNYLFIEPRGAIAFLGTRDFIGLLAYIISCAIIIGFGEAMHSRRRGLESEKARALDSEAAYRTATQNLQIVTDSMAAPVARCGRDLRYLWVSKTFTDWYGCPADEVVGRPIIDIIGKAAFEQLLPRFQQVLSGHKVHYDEEVDYQQLGRRWISATYTRTFDEAGVPDGWVAIVLDITEQKRIEQALAQSERRLASELEAITRLEELEREVLDIAAQEQRRLGQELHDSVGQELTGLGLMADALAQRLRASSPGTEELSGKIAAGLARVHEQVRSLARGLVPVEVDPEGLWSALEDLALRTSEQAKVSCTFENTGPPDLSDTTTATHLFRIAQEAVSNALRHGRPRNIRISLAVEPANLIVNVQDDGVGIAASAGQERGLGIRLMRNGVGVLGGTISVEPATGEGTCVTCLIPRKPER